MKKLTVFTPTYNRAYCLNNCYESLKRQMCKGFIWLIIDDGSVDHTKELVDKWISEGVIEIRYHWQENQGMHAAHNIAYKLIDTELNICIDSDDYMPDDAVQKVLSFWSKYRDEKFSGIVALDSYTDGQIVGSELPRGMISSTLFDLYNKYRVSGDKKLVYRTELTKQYPYPVFKGEKYVGLAYKYYKLDQEYEMLLMNEILCCIEYLPDGSTRNMIHQYYKNPRGFSFYRKELMKLPFAKIGFKYKQAIHYVSSSLISKNKKFIKETPCRALTLLAILPGILLYSYVLINQKHQN
ncbi:glycosyltransferase family 2 protein [Bacillus pacificus]|uniref:glycosyltransferase family 2 protein n=1 Tax=Bacillus pacificus TaxID=2026187 RepID=UPI003D248941